MKKIMLIICAAALLTLGLSGCGRNKPDIFGNASPESSAMALYVFDGTSVKCSWMYDQAAEKKLLAELSKASLKPAVLSADRIVPPIYGIEIGQKDGFMLSCAFTDGLLVTQDGAAYEFGYDAASLETKREWTDENEFSSTAFFPCARSLSEIDGRWNTGFMLPAAEPEPPAGITAALISWDNDAVKIDLTNDTAQEWTYGEHFSLQTKLDGVWYDVPATSGNVAFIDIGYILEAGQSREKNCPLWMYGTLPAGDYRLISDGLSVEYTVK